VSEIARKLELGPDENISSEAAVRSLGSMAQDAQPHPVFADKRFTSTARYTHSPFKATTNEFCSHLNRALHALRSSTAARSLSSKAGIIWDRCASI
jgi:hypothetical protein